MTEGSARVADPRMDGGVAMPGGDGTRLGGAPAGAASVGGSHADGPHADGPAGGRQLAHAPAHAGGPHLAHILGAATGWTIARPDAWPIALLAFLARGGIVAVALPFLVLPTPIGIASWIGADAITAGGPAVRLIALTILVATGAAGLLILGSVVAAAADRVVLVEWAADVPDALDMASPGEGEVGVPARSGASRRARGAAGTVARIIAIRVVAAIPPIAATAWAVPRLADAVYRQLTLPDDLASPLALRVVAMAPEALATIIIAFLVGELIAGIATVHVVVGGDGAARGLARIPGDIARRPAAVLGAYTIGIVLLVIGVAVPLAAGVVAWDAAWRALARGSEPVTALAAVAAFIGIVVAALAVDAAVATWRRASMAGALAGRSRPRASEARVTRVA